MYMRRLLLFWAFLIPTLLWAQDDSKYLAGAVPEENGKVVFSKEIKVNSFSEDQVFDIMLKWAQDRFKGDVTRVVYSDKNAGDIAAVGREYIVFQNNALSLDRSLMNYRVMIKCADNNCTLKVYGIRYEYVVSYKREPEKYVAEEWITDNFSLNKDKTKLYRGSKKFRIKTVDYVNDIFKEAISALGTAAVEEVPSAQNANVAAQAAKKEQDVVEKSQMITKKGYKTIEAANLTVSQTSLMAESTLQVSSERNNELKENAVSWKGIGNMFGKFIASVAMNPGSETFKQIGNNDNYSISFFVKDKADEAWMIIECQKVGETTEGGQKAIAGEILKIFVK